jgi:hypothetical protein
MGWTREEVRRIADLATGSAGSIGACVRWCLKEKLRAAHTRLPNVHRPTVHVSGGQLTSGPAASSQIA